MVTRGVTRPVLWSSRWFASAPELPARDCFAYGDFLGRPRHEATACCRFRWIDEFCASLYHVEAPMLKVCSIDSEGNEKLPTSKANSFSPVQHCWYVRSNILMIIITRISGCHWVANLQTLEQLIAAAPRPIFINGTPVLQLVKAVSATYRTYVWKLSWNLVDRF